MIAQLRTTNLNESIHFYTNTLGLTLEFQYEDFYAGVRAGTQLVHLKLVDQTDPSIAFVDRGDHFHLYFDTEGIAVTADALRRRGVAFAKDLHETPWGPESSRSRMIRDTSCTSGSASSETQRTPAR